MSQEEAASGCQSPLRTHILGFRWPDVHPMPLSKPCLTYLLGPLLTQLLEDGVCPCSGTASHQSCHPPFTHLAETCLPFT